MERTKKASAYCVHCTRVQDLHLLPDYACPNGENIFTPELDLTLLTVDNLKKLVHHCYLYSGYPRNGYDKMEDDMKALYWYCYYTHYCEEDF